MEPEEMADRLGVHIKYRQLNHGWWGVYDLENRLIILEIKLEWVQRRSAVWHELGHAYFEHPSWGGKYERQASLWACKHLIDESEFFDALRQSNDRLTVAHILNVTQADVQNYYDALHPTQKLLVQGLVTPNTLDLGAQREAS